VVFSAIDAGLISGSDVEEPVEVGMDLNLAVLAVDGDVCTDLEAVGGVPPMQIVEAFGTRSQFRLGGLSIVHNNGHRGWWFAEQVKELLRRLRQAASGLCLLWRRFPI